MGGRRESLATARRAVPRAYARWREAEAQLLLGGVVRDQVESSLRAAHATATELGAAPLRAEIEALTRRGRLTLAPAPEATPPAPQPPSPLDRLGLTAASGRCSR